METRKIDNFELQLVPMAEEHIPRLHELSIAVNWPHRPEDWAVALALGEGVVAFDEIGRPVSSAMLFPLGEGVANIGMVITSPRLQNHGAARWLMDEMLQRTKGKVRRLNATKAAYNLYLSMGFQPYALVLQHQGTAIALPGEDTRVRSMTDADNGAIIDADRRGFGSDRSHVVEHLLPLSEATVLEENGRINGYALCRRFGRGHVLGPVVAASEEDAIALIRPLIAAHEGNFLRMDTRHPNGPLQAALEQAGLVLFDHVTTMQLEPIGKMPELTVYGLANQALG
ncbi:GNAT family N-acetyltransferase [Rhizobium sp. NFR12]|jgi:GNAT superfamily N-acetyltransferase|uniref:GNAT family N-acetyltransferase n=1 Tax=Rhizobium sp. NFR12 TaxID=1566261 RepID=UPI0008A7C22D|nr:GNAT family N-acetyltransferase [Rhizobium sp. NFR12]SEH26114.1 Acetyltransferase (GNAT) domain-containing protein [Rhizobium sp. NFR12]